MSSRSKGMAYEREFEAILKSKGYETQRVKGSTKFNKNVDFFGHWDIIGFACELRKIVEPRNWILVQVKTQYTNAEFKGLQDWKNMHTPPNCKCFFAIRNKGKSFIDRWRLIEIK